MWRNRSTNSKLSLVNSVATESTQKTSVVFKPTLSREGLFSTTVYSRSPIHPSWPSSFTSSYLPSHVCRLLTTVPYLPSPDYRLLPALIHRPSQPSKTPLQLSSISWFCDIQIVSLSSSSFHLIQKHPCSSGNSNEDAERKIQVIHFMCELFECWSRDFRTFVWSYELSAFSV